MSLAPLPLQNMKFDERLDVVLYLFREVFNMYLKVCEQYEREDEAKRMNTPHPRE